jgi:hypothetical protein
MARFVRLRLIASIIVLTAAPLNEAPAAPPPPPPSYVMDVAHLLTNQEDTGTIARLSNFVADDVRAYVNDKLVADGKANWTRYWAPARHSLGGVLAYSPDWRANGSLMIVDEYDTVNRADLPPGFVADPRYTSRATLYQFGPDHKIHAIRTIVGGGFWIKP